MRSTFYLIVTLTILAGCANNSVAQQAVPKSNTRQSKVALEIWQQVNAGETVVVIVTLAVPSSRSVNLSPDEKETQRKARDKAVAELIRDLQGTRHRIVNQYQSVPGLAMEVGTDALRALDRSPAVFRVDENITFEPGGVMGPELGKTIPK